VLRKLSHRKHVVKRMHIFGPETRFREVKKSKDSATWRYNALTAHLSRRADLLGERSSGFEETINGFFA
jgi:hypothetical protein